MKKNSSTQKKQKPSSKLTQTHSPVQRDTKEVIAELVAKLTEKLDPKPGQTKIDTEGQRATLGPNLDRLTVGVDLGDRWSCYCILGLQGETLAEGQLPMTKQDMTEFFLTGCSRGDGSRNAFGLGPGSRGELWARSARRQSAPDGRAEAPAS